jgi:hypothetical protein
MRTDFEQILSIFANLQYVFNSTVHAHDCHVPRHIIFWHEDKIEYQKPLSEIAHNLNSNRHQIYLCLQLMENILRILNHIGSVLASSVVDRGFEPRSGQIKDYEIGMCCFSAKHALLRRKSKD